MAATQFFMHNHKLVNNFFVGKLVYLRHQLCQLQLPDGAIFRNESFSV